MLSAQRKNVRDLMESAEQQRNAMKDYGEYLQFGAIFGAVAILYLILQIFK
jgi:hypothetical protein